MHATLTPVLFASFLVDATTSDLLALLRPSTIYPHHVLVLLTFQIANATELACLIKLCEKAHIGKNRVECRVDEVLQTALQSRVEFIIR